MKHTIILAATLLSFQVFAAFSWQNQTVDTIYTNSVTIPLRLDSQTFTIPSGTQMTLMEVEELNMLNVFLHKYKTAQCPSNTLETDLELMKVGGKSVGINLVRNCILEVYIEKADYSAKSFLE